VRLLLVIARRGERATSWQPDVHRAIAYAHTRAPAM
jgi:hypothetical protein